MHAHDIAKPATDILAHILEDDGVIPNSRLPLLIYRAALSLPNREPAAAVEELLAGNDWSGSWRNGIYSFHHYHSTTHEVLACYSGAARVQFGGEQGLIVEVGCGDVVIIPAGVAHKKLSSEDGFAVVGAYPGGAGYDMNCGKVEERPRADEQIVRVPIPKTDPIYGLTGPLLEKWRT